MTMFVTGASALLGEAAPHRTSERALSATLTERGIAFSCLPQREVRR